MPCATIRLRSGMRHFGLSSTRTWSSITRPSIPEKSWPTKTKTFDSAVNLVAGCRHETVGAGRPTFSCVTFHLSEMGAPSFGRLCERVGEKTSSPRAEQKTPGCCRYFLRYHVAHGTPSLAAISRHR